MRYNQSNQSVSDRGSFVSQKPKILGPVDSAFFYVEGPKTPMNIGAVTIFDGTFSFDDLVNLVDSRIHLAPIYQQRIIQASLNLGQPGWVYDPDFYIGNHMFKVSLDAPGTEEQLRELTGHLLSSVLDREKPLWEIYMIEGLADNRTALFFKVHHCMVDGLEAVELFTLLFDLTPDVTPPQKKPLYDPPYLPGKGRMVVDAFRQDLPHKWKVVKKLGHDFGRLGAAFLDKEQRRKALVGIANLVNDNLTPIKRLPINGSNSGAQQMAWAEFSLAEVRAIKTTRRASVNDVMLTIYSGAIEEYSKTHEEELKQDFLRVLVPVSMRVEKERGSYGNRISVLPVDIPFGIDDPLDRLQTITEYTKVMKESALSNSLDIALTLPSLAPAVTQPLVWSIAPKAFAFVAHTWCTNVAGPQIPMYLLGCRLLHTFGFFPLNPSMGLACVITSYNQRIAMNLVVDTGIISDPTELRGYLEKHYLELRQAAKVQPIEPIEMARTKAKSSPSAKVEPEPELTPKPEEKSEAKDNSKLSKEANIVTVEAESPPSETSELPQAVLEISKPVDAGAVRDEQPTDNDVALATEAQPAPVAEAIVETAPTPEPAPEPTPAGKPRLFSQPWADNFQKAINGSVAYRKASTKWEAGSLAFVITVGSSNGFQDGAAVLLDLHKGHCRSAQSTSIKEVQARAAFVIEGDYNAWMKVLKGKAKPLMMIMRGKLKLSKGSLRKLLPFTQSAQELVNCAQQVS